MIKYDLEKTDVRELQILRDYSDYLSIFRVFGGSIYSSCSDGHIYNHAFPELNNETVHYDMAYDEEGNRINFLSWEGNGIMNDMEIMNLWNELHFYY